MKNQTVVLSANRFFALYNFRREIIRNLQDAGHHVVLCAESDGFEANFEDANVTIHAHQKNNKIPLINEISFVIFLARCFLKYPGSAQLTFTIRNNIFIGLLSALFGRKHIPNITGMGSTWDLKVLRPFVSLVYRLSFYRSYRVIVQNQRDFTIFKKILRSSECVLKVNGSGVNLNEFQLPPKPRNFETINVAMVSRLVKKKGYKTYLDAAKYYKKQYPNSRIRFKFVSGYEARPEFLSSLKANYDDVEFISFTSTIADFLQSVDLVVFPSFYNEGTPRILIEGLASGCAILTSNQPGCCDTVVESSNGYILRNANYKELSDLIAQYVSLDAGEKTIFSLNSRRIAKDNYDELSIASLYLDIIQKSG